VVVGGFIRNGQTPTPVSDRVYQLVNGVWQPLPSLNHGRAAAAAAVVGDKIVVMGGQANEQEVLPAEVFDGAHWHDAAPMHTSRDHLAAVADDHFVYAVGGRVLTANKNLASFERYDPTTDQWQQLPNLPTPRGGLGAAVVGSRLVALGGEGVASALGNVEAFDFTTATWASLPAMPTPRHGMAVLVLGNALYAIDGGAGAGHFNSTPTNETVQLSPVPAGGWTTLRAAPTARQQVASTVAFGKLWILGGLTSDATSTAAAEAYDPAVNQWEVGPSLPRALDHSMAVTYRGVPVVIGGFVRNGQTPTPVSDHVYQLVNGTWQALPSLNHARAAGAAAVVGDRIVVVGGQANEQLVSATEVFDGTHWHDVAPMPTPRDHLAAAADDHYVYAVGGRVLTANKNLAAVERYDPTANSWQTLPPLPAATGGLGATIVGNRLIALGGEGVAQALNNVQAFAFATNTWSNLAAMPTARHGMAVLGIGNAVYAIDGGAAAGHFNSTATSEMLAFS
jgi:non-specific serine/threonine protein kinase